MPCLSRQSSGQSEMPTSPTSLDEYDLAFRGRNHEGGNAFDSVNQTIQVFALQAEHVHRQSARLDVDHSHVLRLAQQLAPMLAGVGLDRRRLIAGRIRGQLVVVMERALSERVERVVLQKD